LKLLRGYKDNTRPGYDASMGEQLQPISEEDIQDLAYFAARQP
jgi:cytochrome c553